MVPNETNEKREALSYRYQEILQNPNTIASDKSRHKGFVTVKAGLKPHGSAPLREKAHPHHSNNNIALCSEKLPVRQREPEISEDESPSSHRKIPAPPSSSSSSLHNSRRNDPSLERQLRETQQCTEPQQQWLQNQIPFSTINRNNDYDSGSVDSRKALNNGSSARSSKEFNQFTQLLPEEAPLDEESPRKSQPSTVYGNNVTSHADSRELGNVFYAYHSLNDDIVNHFIQETKEHSSVIPDIFSNNQQMDGITQEYEKNICKIHELIIQRNEKTKSRLFKIENNSLKLRTTNADGSEDNRMETWRQKFRLSLNNCGELLQKSEQLYEYNNELFTFIQKYSAYLNHSLEKTTDYLHECREEFQKSIATYQYALKWNIHVESIENIQRVRMNNSIRSTSS
jgi:hypothetical protein